VTRKPGAAGATGGYSGTPLATKLGIKTGFCVRTANAPQHYAELLAPLPPNVRLSSRARRDVDLWHLFTASAQELRTQLPLMLSGIKQDGMIWVSWPKQASKRPTDVSDNTIREFALPLGLVDVKVCPIDEIWSGLKLVIRKDRRRGLSRGRPRPASSGGAPWPPSRRRAAAASACA
jgi:hypothetical protein